MKNMKRMNRSMQKGFTLIELMIVIAIIAILVALAVPAYQDYTVRTKVGECIGQAASAKLAVAEHYQSMAALPTSSAQAGVDMDATLYCASMAVGTGGAITVTTQATGADGSAPVARFTPVTGGGNIASWNCSIVQGDAKYFPSSCRGT